MNKDLNLSLVRGGGDPIRAHLHNAAYSITDYKKALTSDEYIQFAKDINVNFLSNIDLHLLASLWKAEEAMQQVGPESASYARIQKNYIDILKLTLPLVERLSRHTIEVSIFDDIELFIGDDDKVSTEI